MRIHHRPGVLLPKIADSNNPVALDADVGLDGRPTSPIVHRAVLDEDIESALLRLSPEEGRKEQPNHQQARRSREMSLRGGSPMNLNSRFIHRHHRHTLQLLQQGARRKAQEEGRK